MPEPLEPAEAPNALIGPNTIEQLLLCARGTPAGCFVEVGVFQGGSAMHLNALAEEQNRALYLYDTFQGMPWFEEGLDCHPLGDFANTNLERVQRLCPGAIITAGIFPESAVEMPPISFAHIDVDNYRSVLETAAYLKDRMVSGGVMWFDDSPCLASAAKATKELFGQSDYGRALKLSFTGQHYVTF